MTSIQRLLGYWVIAIVLSTTGLAFTQDKNLEFSKLKNHLTFLASFDESFDADFAKGNKKVMTASEVSRKTITDGLAIDGIGLSPDGKWGQAIDFKIKTKKIACYGVKDNFPYSAKSFDATVSFWMRTDLANLPKGFIDPLQITDKKWDDSSIFVDFNDKPVRDFRLGVFSDLKFWNPENAKLDDLPQQQRPMIDAGHVKFSKAKWIHIVITLNGINHGQETLCKLFMDGKLVGKLNRRQQFTWDLEKAFIMIGIYYVGQIDDFAIFKKALTPKQVQSIYLSPNSLSSLLK